MKQEKKVNDFCCRTISVLIVLSVIDGILLVLLYATNFSLFRWLAIPLNWPSFFVLPDESDEMLGLWRSLVIAWCCSIPWFLFLAVSTAYGSKIASEKVSAHGNSAS